MADRTIKVLTPATQFDLITLDECKLMMGMSVTDTSNDAQLELFTSLNSAQAARLCNHKYPEENPTFARMEIQETWRGLGSQLAYPGYYYPDPPIGFYSGTALRSDAHRLFLAQWPVKTTDVESVESPAGTVLDPTAYEIEEDSGKLEILNGIFQEPTVVTYWGGFRLPDECPPPIKQACVMLNVQSKLLATIGTLAGIRILSHKSSRVGFHDPLKMLEAAMGGGAGKGGGPMSMPVMNLLSHYIRYEV